MDEFENAFENLKGAAPKTEGTYERFSRKAQRHEAENIHAKKNPHVGRAIGISCGVLASAVILLPAVPFLVAAAQIRETHRDLSRSYTIKEAQAIQAETFRRLNSFTYLEGGFGWNVEDSYRDAVNGFTETVYHAMQQESNGVFSPLSLYLHFDLLSHGLSNESQNALMDSLLYLDKEGRDKNFLDAFYGNRREGKTFVSMVNGSFLDDAYTYTDSYLGYLTGKYVEAFSMDFAKDEDLEKMVAWANGNLNDPMIEQNDIAFDNAEFALFSLLNFRGKWGFEKNDTVDAPFLCKNGSTATVKMMHKTLYGKAYCYDDYWSFSIPFTDRYVMQILTPDQKEDDIFALLEGKAFLDDDPSRAYVTERGDEEYLIEVDLPRFETASSLSFRETFSSLGLDFLYDDMSPSLDGIAQGTSLFLLDTKQKNKIVWDEDGARGVSITFSSGMGAAAPAPDGLHFTMDSPFVYVIKDANGLPLYLGNVSSF